MQKNIIKKGLVIAVIFLFIAVSFQPVFAVNIKPTDETVVESKSSNDEKVEYVIQIIKTNKIIENKIYLTQLQANDLENLIDNIRADLNNSESFEESSEIYNNAINSFDNLGLFPEDITIDEIKQLVFGETQKLSSIKFKNKISSEFENSKCYVSGKTTDTYFLRPSFAFLLLIFGQLMIWFSFLLFWFFPIRIGYIVYLGETHREPSSHPIIYYYPAVGWIYTNGLNGEKKYSGTFYGNIIDRSPYEAIFIYYPGIFGFTGIRIGKNGWTSSVFYMGYALKVAITTSV